MFGNNKMFTFTGNSLKDRAYESIERNYEEYYHRLRVRGYVPLLGSEEINLGQESEFSVGWTLNIIGKQCEDPWMVRGVTQEGDVEWFTMDEDMFETYSEGLV